MSDLVVKSAVQDTMKEEESNIELLKLKNKEGIGVDIPTEVKDYLKYTEALEKIWNSSTKIDCEFKNKIIKKLISRIEVNDNGVVVHYHVGKNQIKKESLEDSFFKAVSEPIDFSENNKVFSKNVGSRTCNNGAPRRTRTTDTRIFSPLLYQLSYQGT